jgi:hypothetical protein
MRSEVSMCRAADDGRNCAILSALATWKQQNKGSSWSLKGALFLVKLHFHCIYFTFYLQQYFNSKIKNI